MILHTDKSEKDFLKFQSLFTGFATFLIAVFYFCFDSPFDRKIYLITLIASCMYFTFYIFFDLTAKYRTIIIKIMSFLGLIYIGMLIHYSGGIASPFVFVYIALVFSELLYLNEDSLTAIFAIISYVAVIMGEYSGVLEVSNDFAEKIYSSGAITFLIAGIFIVAVISTGHIGKLLVSKLKAALKKEEEDKEVALIKYMELNSYSQIGILSHRIAHDLRGLFFILSSYFEMQPKGDKEGEEDKKIIMEHLKGMKYMISQITKYGKPSVEKKEKINVIEFMENMLVIVKLFEGAKIINFKVDFPKNRDLYIFVSRQELQNAYFNIFKNAIEALENTKGEKNIEVDVLQFGKELKIIISDNGIGIKENVRSKVFISPITSKKDGTGIGLFIIKRIFEQNEGLIKIEGREKNGTMVTTQLRICSK